MSESLLNARIGEKVSVVRFNSSGRRSLGLHLESALATGNARNYHLGHNLLSRTYSWVVRSRVADPFSNSETGQ